MTVLGIDVGSGGTRAVIVNDRGAVLSSATEEHAPLTSPSIGWAEQRPQDWWRACGIAIPKALAIAGLSGDQIQSVGLSGQMHGAVLLDRRGDVVRPALIWCDQRTEPQCLGLSQRIGRAQILDLTCNTPLTNFTLPKLLWVRENEPDHWKRVTSFLLPKDYVRYRLTDEFATDVTDASGTLLFDVAQRRWSSAMRDHADIDERLFPKAYESVELCGRVSAEGAAVTGLKMGTPVVAGAGDQAAGAVGMGVVRPGTVSATIGSSGVVFAATDAPVLDPQGRLHTFCHAVPGRLHVMGVTQAAGLSLRWFHDRFGTLEGGIDPYEALSAEAATVPAGADGLLWARIGETQDARLEQRGWDDAAFDDSRWMPAQLCDVPSGRVVAQVDPPIRAIQELKPQRITELKPGVYVADFGQNFTGWCRLRLTGAPGTRIEFAFAELVGPAGEIEQPYGNIGWPKKDVYILKGDPNGETFEPPFTFRGFRYVQLTGLPTPPTTNTVVGVAIRSNLRPTGVIRSDQALIEEIWHATARTHDANLIGLPIDTPSREQRPFAEVSEIIWDGASYDRDVAALTSRVMDVIVDNQLPDGIFPRRVLTPLYNNEFEDTLGSTPGHGEAAIVLPWIARQRYGDAAIIERSWSAMNRHVQCILGHNSDHIWRTYRGHDEGDWYALDVSDPDPGLPHTPKDVVGTAFWAHALDLLAQMGAAIRRPAEAARLHETHARVRAAFATSFVQADGAVANGSQTSYVLALAFDLVPAALRERAASRLVADIRRRGTSLTTGIFGTQFVLDALAATGFTDVAYELLLRTDYPSWGHMVRQDGGTIWETWSGFIKAKEQSGTVLYPMGRNHPDLASTAGFLFRHFAGIEALTPGFETIEIRPTPHPHIRKGGGDYDSVMGRISTDWTQRTDGGFSLAISIPANTTARVHLPATPGANIRESRRDIRSGKNIRLLERSSQEAVLEIGSGDYRFVVTA